ncbi:BTB/POZ domain-containing protein [Rhizophagus irregularis DAOM 181602=DAOM 197198]|nr:BTB/POZ domain-containing protein [Rhizophagus irregularis DAOM 181602=DAOM 197198]
MISMMKLLNIFQILPPRFIFDSKIINATDVALIASWIDKKKGTPYYFKDLPLKFNLIYRASRDCFRIGSNHLERPYFGLQDLYIKSSGSFINNIVGKSKQHPYEKKIINRETFKIEEYEVFQVIIDNRLSTLILIRVQKIFKKSFNIIKRRSNRYNHRKSDSTSL